VACQGPNLRPADRHPDQGTTPYTAQFVWRGSWDAGGLEIFQGDLYPSMVASAGGTKRDLAAKLGRKQYQSILTLLIKYI
jgi:hypothetical protein